MTGCTIPYKIRKVQWEIQAGKGPKNIKKIDLDFTATNCHIVVHNISRRPKLSKEDGRIPLWLRHSVFLAVWLSRWMGHEMAFQGVPQTFIDFLPWFPPVIYPKEHDPGGQFYQAHCDHALMASCWVILVTTILTESAIWGLFCNVQSRLYSSYSQKLEE